MRPILRALTASAVLIVAARVHAADPLPSWNDGPAKKAVVEFVASDGDFEMLQWTTSLFELKDTGDAKSIDLYFGPQAPAGKEGVWVRTTPGKGWFAYFRIYGPKGPAFDGSWKPGDFEEVR